MHLVPCSECERHIRNLDAACPFCGASISESMRAFAPALPRKRLGRSALASFRAIGAASVIALAAAGCGSSEGGSETTESTDTSGNETSVSTDGTADDSTELEDGSSQGFMPDDTEGGEGGLQPAYGTPP